MRLIDAHDLMERLYDANPKGRVELAELIKTEPTVDAVEVVRCKDCKFSRSFTEEELKAEYRVGEWHCAFWYAEMHEDDYCSCGKRRTGGIEKAIDDAPTVDPVKHGKWRYDEALELEWCSECGFGKRKGDKRWYSYCPNCGCKMEVKDVRESD